MECIRRTRAEIKYTRPDHGPADDPVAALLPEEAAPMKGESTHVFAYYPWLICPPRPRRFARAVAGEPAPEDQNQGADDVRAARRPARVAGAAAAANRSPADAAPAAPGMDGLPRRGRLPGGGVDSGPAFSRRRTRGGRVGAIARRRPAPFQLETKLDILRDRGCEIRII